MFKKLALVAIALALPGLFAPGDKKMVAKDPGTQVTLGNSAVVLAQRESRNFGQIVSLKTNTTNVSCTLQTAYAVLPSASLVGIVLAPGDAWDTCGSSNSCFGGAVACRSVTGSPVVFTVDY